MTSIRPAFLNAAVVTADLLADPIVSAAWDQPSALAGFSVGGLSAHLATQVITVEAGLDRDVSGLEQVTLLDHYRRSPWVDAGVDEDANLGIVAHGESAAGEGPDALVAKVTSTLSRLHDRIEQEPGDRVAAMPWWNWSLRLDDLLVIRMMEMAVHCDDLTVSVGLPTPPMPEDVTGPVLALLSQLALRRHGATALLRAYSRAERAPSTIAAF
jgi:hypothetical protein